jgi:hypothetical protein
MKQNSLQHRCDRNRKRSKRRALYCPIDGQYLDSVSPKYTLFADRSEQLQERGMARKTALLLMSTRTTVTLEREWLEAFWCCECQRTQWYHVRKVDDRTYSVCAAPAELWQQAQNVSDPRGNPSVGEFTRRQSRMMQHNTLTDFKFVN